MPLILYCWSVLLDHSLARHHSSEMAQSDVYEDLSTLHLIVTEEQREAIAKLYQENGWSFSTISNNQDNSPSRILIPQSETDPECQYCLCRPCITNECNRQLWWEHHNHEPSDMNSRRRKPIYKRFWTMLYHRGVWLDTRYLDRKSLALENRRYFAWSGPRGQGHPRDIMPQCITSLVRTWLPNPKGRDYMGHRWT